MYIKKTENKFTIQFSRIDPAHLRVADIINRLERSFKAQYIADAVLYYESRKTMRHQVSDERHIESVIRRILRDREESGAGILPAAAPAGQVEKSTEPTAEIHFDEAMEALGVDGFNAIAGALDMFRKK